MYLLFFFPLQFGVCPPEPLKEMQYLKKLQSPMPNLTVLASFHKGAQTKQFWDGRRVFTLAISYGMCLLFK